MSIEIYGDNQGQDRKIRFKFTDGSLLFRLDQLTDDGEFEDLIVYPGGPPRSGRNFTLNGGTLRILRETVIDGITHIGGITYTLGDMKLEMDLDDDYEDIVELLLENADENAEGGQQENQAGGRRRRHRRHRRRTSRYTKRAKRHTRRRRC